MVKPWSNLGQTLVKLCQNQSNPLTISALPMFLHNRVKPSQTILRVTIRKANELWIGPSGLAPCGIRSAECGVGASAANEHQPQTKEKNMTRYGKIARLPAYIRDELGERMEKSELIQVNRT
jgi:hypothetical protein